MNELICLRHFIEIVEQQGLTNASSVNGVSVSVLSKHLAWLEKKYNTPLIERSTRSFSVTKAGLLCLERAKQALSYLEDTRKTLTSLGNSRSGLVSIGSPPAMNQAELSACLTQLCHQYPKLEIAIQSDNYPFLVINRDVDIAISSTKISHESLRGYLLTSMQRNIFAAPAYVEKHGKPKYVSELKTHLCLINNRYAMAKQWEFADGERVFVHGTFSSDNSEDLLSAALNGIGLLNVPGLYLKQFINEGALVEIKLDKPVADLNMYLYHAKQRLPANVLNVVEYILSYFKNR